MFCMATCPIFQTHATSILDMRFYPPAKSRHSSPALKSWGFLQRKNKKFLKNKIKKNSEYLISAYEHGLVNFHFMGEIGTITHEDTELIEENS